MLDSLDHYGMELQASLHHSLLTIHQLVKLVMLLILILQLKFG